MAPSLRFTHMISRRLLEDTGGFGGIPPNELTNDYPFLFRLKINYSANWLSKASENRLSRYPSGHALGSYPWKLGFESIPFKEVGLHVDPFRTALPERISLTDPDASQAAVALLGRLLPNHIDRFTFLVIPPETGRDVFEIETHDSKVVIGGNTSVSMAMGLNWYLKHHCRCHVSWYGDQLTLPNPLPLVESKVRRVAWARHRYFLNYCCFGYSLPFWDWAQWQRLIDWMALNGVNMPLSVTGQEGV